MKERIDRGRSFNDPMRDKEREGERRGQNPKSEPGTRHVQERVRHVSERVRDRHLRTNGPDGMDGDMVCMHLSVSLFQHMSISIMKVMVMRVHPRNQMCDCVAAGFSFFW